MQQAGLSNIAAAAAAAALNSNSAYHAAAAAAAAGFPDEGAISAHHMSCARPSIALQSRMRGNGDGVGGAAFSFRLPSRARNSNHINGGSGVKRSARFGVYPKILLEDDEDEDEDEDESVYGGRGTAAGISRFQNHPARLGQNPNSEWAERTAESMNRVEIRMASVDGRLAERSEQLRGLRYGPGQSKLQ